MIDLWESFGIFKEIWASLKEEPRRQSVLSTQMSVLTPLNTKPHKMLYLSILKTAVKKCLDNVVQSDNEKKWKLQSYFWLRVYQKVKSILAHIHILYENGPLCKEISTSGTNVGLKLKILKKILKVFCHFVSVLCKNKAFHV